MFAATRLPCPCEEPERHAALPDLLPTTNLSAYRCEVTLTPLVDAQPMPPPPPVSRWSLLPIFLRAGFTGGLVIDYPNSTKAKKYYLCLSFEHGYKTPAAKVAEPQGGAAAAKFDVSGYLESDDRSLYTQH